MSDELEPVILVSRDIRELFRTLNKSEGEVILDLSMEREHENPYIRVYNGTPQLIVAHPLPEERTEDYEIESHEISQEKFEDIVINSETILMKSREDTPFSREAQKQLWNKEFTG
jgi:hypothetical protein